MSEIQNQVPATQAGGARGGPGKRSPRRTIWNIEEKIRQQLERGIDLGGGRKLATAFTYDVAWVKVDEIDKTVVVTYVKGVTRITVQAQLRRGGRVEIVSVALGTMYRCKDSQVGLP
jgi:hypothetical protein